MEGGCLSASPVFLPHPQHCTPMRILILAAFFIAPVLFGMTPDEFKALYESTAKTADTCYRLYQAYKDGDGVEQSDTHARKWLLAAHASGMISTRKEIANLPWRGKLKKAIKAASVSDDEAQKLGQEVFDMLASAYKANPHNVALQPQGTPLPKAKTKELRKLIQAGADLNVIDTSGGTPRTALYLACQYMDLSTAKLLIEGGADPSACSNIAMELSFSREIPTPSAVPSKARSRLKKVKDKGISAGEQLFNFLMKNGADPGMWTHYGWSMPYVAAFCGSASGIQRLSNAGVDMDARQNPYECAPQKGNADYFSYRKKIGAIGDRGNAFNFAAANADEQVAKALIKCGVATDLKQFGQTPVESINEALQHSSNADFNARYKAILAAIKASQK